MFTPGQKVVCVDDDFPDEIKSTYTIRDIGMGHDVVRRDEIYCTVVELVNPPGRISGIEKGFRADRFAPLMPDLEEETEEELVFTSPQSPLAPTA
jgi:hypothetical protein